MTRSTHALGRDLLARSSVLGGVVLLHGALIAVLAGALNSEEIPVLPVTEPVFVTFVTKEQPVAAVTPPSPEPASKPEPKPEPKPDPKPDPVPAPKPLPKPQSKPVPEPEPEPELQPATKPKPRPVPTEPGKEQPAPPPPVPAFAPEPVPPEPSMPPTQAIAQAPSRSPGSSASPSAAPGTSATSTIDSKPATATVPAAPSTTAEPRTVTSGIAYVRKPAPRYPSVSRRLGEEGRVELQVLVDVKGRPERVEVKRSSGSRRLDEAARQAALAALFEPHMENGRPVPMFAIVPIEFKLDS